MDGLNVTLEPNIVHEGARIGFELKRRERATVMAVDINGTAVAAIADELFEPGAHRIEWKTGDIPSGIYFVIVESSGRRPAPHTVVVR